MPRYDSAEEAAFYAGLCNPECQCGRCLGKRLDRNRDEYEKSQRREKRNQRLFDITTKAILWTLTPIAVVLLGYGMATHKPPRAPETQLDRIERTLNEINRAIGTPAEKV